MALRDDEGELCIHVMLQQSGDPALKTSVSLQFQIDKVRLQQSPRSLQSYPQLGFSWGHLGNVGQWLLTNVESRRRNISGA
jgi:hypothetical protein